MQLPVSYIVEKFYAHAGYPTYHKYTNSYMGGCPACHEGKSWGRKKRLYYVVDKNYLHCHNCGKTWNPINWIMEVAGLTYENVLKEAAEHDDDFVIRKVATKIEKPKVSTLPDDSINLFDTLQTDYYHTNKVVQDALAFIKRRRLNTAINKPTALYISLKDFIHKNRVCIPFYDPDKKIRFYQTRALYKEQEEQAKYLSKVNAEKTVFGIDKINPNMDTLFIFEGPIDAMFVQNGIAVGGIHFTAHQAQLLQQYHLYRRIWILDNQLDNEDVAKKVEQLKDKKESVFVWPKALGSYKDINEFCMDRKLDEIPAEFFLKRAFSGLKLESMLLS